MVKRNLIFYVEEGRKIEDEKFKLSFISERNNKLNFNIQINIYNTISLVTVHVEMLPCNSTFFISQEHEMNRDKTMAMNLFVLRCSEASVILTLVGTDQQYAL